MRRVIAVAVFVLVCGGSGTPDLLARQDDRATESSPRLWTRLPKSSATTMKALSELFDEQAAFDLVVYMDRFWRLAANAGYNATIERVSTRLTDAGFASRDAGGTSGPVQWVEEYGQANGWDYTVGTLTLLGQRGQLDEILLSRERHRVALCINSFSTPDGGIVAPIVDVGAGGAEADYAGKDVKGAVVLGDASTGRLWQMAVVERGAIGVVSTTLAPYIAPGPFEAEARTPRQEWNVLQWGSIPYDEARRGFGFKASPRAATAIRTRLAIGPARVKVEVSSTFSPGPVKTLVAEIPGRTKPDERIVLAAHVQEPGANDNASGCATLQELARAIAIGVREKRIPPPARTLTFLWLDEIRGSRQWLQDHPDEAKQVRYMISLDMTGEDTTKTGGTFLIEKAPDPTAVWDRPSDPHTEWGRGNVKAESLRGTALNDLFLAMCQLRAQDTGWVVRTNPYEGGSDHSVFLASGVPSLLAWHFPDRFYHSSLDRPSMTSPSTMAHVGVSVATTAVLLAGASDTDARSVVALLGEAASARLTLERQQGKDLIAADADREAAKVREAAVIDAWMAWYREALDEVAALPVSGASSRLRTAIATAKRRLR